MTEGESSSPGGISPSVTASLTAPSDEGALADYRGYTEQYPPAPVCALGHPPLGKGGFGVGKGGFGEFTGQGDFGKTGVAQERIVCYDYNCIIIRLL